MAVALLLATTATAQDLLTLDQAVAETLARNRGLEAARAGAREAAARSDEARSGFFPRISASESWQRGNAPVFVFGSLLSSRQFTAANFAIDALNHPDSVGLFHGVMSVEQVLFDGGRTGGAADAASKVRAMADAGGDEMALGLVVGVAQTYGRVLRADAARRAAEAAITAAAEDVARAERRRDVGTVTDADVLSLKVHLAAMRQRAIQANGDAMVARAELNRLRGAPIDAEFTVQEPPPPAASARNWPALVSEAEQARPELKRSEAALGVAAAGRRQARAGWWPQVAAQAAYQFDGTSISDRAASWVVGGEVRWSFSTGGATQAGARAAAAAEQRGRLAHEDTRAAVQVDLRTALSRLESADAREALARATVDQARESQRIVRDRYDAGLAGVADVLTAAAAVLDAEMTRVSALAERIEAHAALNRALGRRP